MMKTGENYSPKKDGYFISDYYLKEVMQAKIDSK